MHMYPMTQPFTRDMALVEPRTGHYNKIFFFF